MSARPLVSVVIPAHNAEAFLGAAISSTLTQTYPNVEVIVCDDGSSDHTADIARAHGDRVRLVQRPQAGGVGAARNAGVEVANGDLIANLDADDILLPPYIEAMVATIGGQPNAFATSEAFLMSSAGIVPSRTVLPIGHPGPERQRRLIIEQNFLSIFGMIPRTMWEELQGWSSALPTCEDWDLWARAIYSGYTARFQTQPYALYRRVSGTMSRNEERMRAGEQLVLERLREQFGASMTADEAAYLELRLTSPHPLALIGQGEEALRDGNAKLAAQRFGQASELWPDHRSLRVKSMALRSVPGAASVYAKRLRQTEVETGRN